MSVEKVVESTKYDRKVLINTLIGLILFVGIGFLTPVEPITKTGMRVLGFFIGSIYLWATVDIVWPSILAIMCFGLFTPYYNPITVVNMSFGDWVPFFIITSFIITATLSKTGFTRRVALWIINLPISKKGPWSFTITFLMSAMILTWFLAPLAVYAFFFPLAKEIVDQVGYEKGDKYPNMLFIATGFTCTMAGSMTPISHPLVIMGFGLFEVATGEAVNMLTYFLVGIPTGLTVFALMMLAFRYIMNPDVTKLRELDIEKLCGEKTKVTIEEKIAAGVFLMCLILWLLPGILGFVAPGSGLAIIFSKIKSGIPPMIGLIILMVVRIKNKPIVKFKQSIANDVPWGVIFLLAGMMLLSGAIGKPENGIMKFITLNIVPITKSLSPFALVVVIVSFTILATNVIANSSIISIMVPAMINIALVTPSLKPLVIALTITSAANYSFMFPSGFSGTALIYGNEYTKSEDILKYGAITLIFAIMANLFIAYPILSSLF